MSVPASIESTVSTMNVSLFESGSSTAVIVVIYLVLVMYFTV